MPVHIKKIHHTKTIYKIVEKPVYVESGLRFHPLQSLQVADGDGAKSDEAVIGGNQNSSVKNILRGLDGNKTKPVEILENGNNRDTMAEVENRPLAISPKNSPTATGLFVNKYFGRGYRKDLESINIVRDGESVTYKHPFKANTGLENSHTPGSYKHDDDPIGKYKQYEHFGDTAFRGNNFKHGHFGDTALYGNPKPRKFGDENQNNHKNNRIFVHGPNKKNYPDITFHGNNNEYPTSRPPVRGQNSYSPFSGSGSTVRRPHGYSAFTGFGTTGKDQNEHGSAVQSPNTYTRLHGSNAGTRGQNGYDPFVPIFGEKETGPNGYSPFPGPVTSVHECKELHTIRGLTVHNELSKPPNAGGKGQYQVQENDVDFSNPISTVSPGLNTFVSTATNQPGSIHESANSINKLSSTPTNTALPQVIIKNVYYTLDPVVPYNDVA